MSVGQDGAALRMFVTDQLVLVKFIAGDSLELASSRGCGAVIVARLVWPHARRR